MLGTNYHSVSRFRFADGSVLEQFADQKGRLHRDNGPALVERRPDDSIRVAKNYLHGQLQPKAA